MAASGSSFATLSINLEARLANLEQGLADATKKTEAAANRMSSALETVNQTGKRIGEVLGSYFSAKMFVDLVAGAIDAQDHLNDLAKRTQLTVEEIGGIGFAASQAGADTESAALAFGKLNLSIAKAAAGNKEAATLYSLVGVSVTDASGHARDANAVFADLADKFASYADGPEKAALGNAIFGRSYQTLLPLLADGGAALRDNIDFYNKYSGVTSDSAKAADNFNDSLGKLHVLSTAFGTKLANELIPTMQILVDRFLDFRKEGTYTDTVVRNIGSSFDALVKAGTTVVGAFAQIVVQIKDMGSTAGAFIDAVRNFSLKSLTPEGVQTIIDKFKSINDASAKAREKIRGDTAASNQEIDDMRSGVNFSNEGRSRPAPKQSAPTIPTKLKGGKTVIDDPAAKQLAATLAMLDEGIKQEQTLLTERNQFLDLYNARGLISIKDYYQQRQNIADEAFAKEEADQIAKIAVLEQARAAAFADKNPKNKPQEKVADLDKQIQAQQARLAEMQKKAGADAILNTEKEKFAQEDFKKTLDATTAKVLELRGSLVAAASINFDQQNESLTKLFTANKNAEGLKSLAILKDHALALAGIAEITKSSARDDEALQSAEERLTLAQQAGGIGELQMLAETGKARAERVRLLEVEVGIQEAIARRDGDKDAMAAADKARLALDKLKATVDPLAERINGIFENSFSNAFTGFITGSRTAAQAFGDFAKSVINDMLKIASQDIAKSLFGGAGGIGGFVSSLLGGGASGGFGSGAAFGNQDLGQFLAVGGVEQPNSLARVNEHGPEMLTVQGKDYLMTGGQSARVTPTGWQGSAGTNINVNIASGVSRNELAALIPSLKAQIKAEIAASQRRPGYAGV